MVRLGKFLRQFAPGAEKQADNSLNEAFYNDFEELIGMVHIYNPWFTELNVRNAIGAIGNSLQEEELINWLSPYISKMEPPKPLNIAVIMAGNIPMVGFHDMLCVLLSGHRFTGKLSSDDKLLLPFLSKVIVAINPEYAGSIVFTEGQLKDIDAVIATGSNNSARYFDYYFGKYPHIIRRNRNSAAVITGHESKEQIRALGEDVFQYFGLGCRNVSKLFVPRGYDFDKFYSAILGFRQVADNNKYANNYEYNRTVYLMSSNPTLLDNNFLLLKEDAGYASPIGVLYYEFYDDIAALNAKLEAEKEQLQCIVSASSEVNNAIPFGQAQCPALSDYADGVDTMAFLTQL